ncbi:hypothetical protein N136_00118 [Leifsonia aquatica ATCC 14665]|uniref:Transposase n=1 Tax=Leifsonia aquatica ATCC 14665 TaxID=1358026 RepID=U2RE79_LEIAQ|nr:hypothetical protein N136_00118 [Leifsonia aquatica ATCC 14665]
MGIGTESLHQWVRRAKADADHRAGVTSSESERIRRLERENRVLGAATSLAVAHMRPSRAAHP